MIGHKKNYFILLNILFLTVVGSMFNLLLSQVEVIDINLDRNIDHIKKMKSFSTIRQVNATNYYWSLDVDSVSIVLDSFSFSNSLICSGYNFSIRNVENIKRVKCIFTGYSKGEGEIEDVVVELVDSNEVISNNYANKYSKGKFWQKNKEAKWEYFIDIDSDKFKNINSGLFGIRFSIKNKSSKFVEAIIKDISLEIEYQPFYSVCNEELFSVRISDLGLGYNYNWDLPDDLIITSNPNSYLINLKYIGDDFGLNTISVNADNGNLKYKGTREILLQDCRASDLSGYFVFNENSCSSAYSNSETLSQVTVKLFEGENVVQEVSLSENGYYAFKNIESGEYRIGITSLNSYYLNSNSKIYGNFYNKDIPNYYESDEFLILPAVKIDSANFEFIKYKKLKFKFWHDLNGDNIENSNENEYFSNSNVYLDQFIAIESDEVENVFNYSHLMEGNHKLCLDSKDSLMFSLERDNCLDFYVSCEDSTVWLSRGAYKYGEISGSVWLDNSVGNEVAIADIGLRLVDSLGQIISVSKSDFSGNYSFDNLDIGRYKIIVAVPDSLAIGNYNISGNGNYNYFKDNGESEFVEVLSGYNINDFDCGFIYRKCELGDFVWFDTNENGLQDNDEPGIEGIEVHLNNSINDDIVQKVVSNEIGEYTFTEIEKGEYYISVDFPDKLKLTASNFSVDEKNSDISILTRKSQKIKLDAGENRSDIDIGFVNNYGSIHSRVWFDENGNGLLDKEERSVENVRLSLFDEHDSFIESKVNNISGFGEVVFDSLISGSYYIIVDSLNIKYKLTNYNIGNDRNIDSDFFNNNGAPKTALFFVEPGKILQGIDLGLVENYGSIAGSVWKDNNENGIKEQIEEVLGNVKVELYSNEGEIIASLITSDGIGKYRFDNLSKGEYYIRFVVPQDFRISSYQGAETNITNDFGVGTTKMLSLSWGENIISINGAFVSNKGSIGDRIWFDENGNGVLDLDEIGVEGIIVELIGENDSIVSKTVSNFAGKYLFEDVEAGNYSVRFFIRDDYLITNDGEFSNTQFKVVKSGEYAVTDVFELKISENKKDIDLGVRHNYSTIGNLVWLDKNKNGIKENYERGVDGIIIRLLNSEDQSIKEVSTNKNGNYRFRDVVGGEYKLEIGIPDYMEINDFLGNEYSIKADLGESVTELFTVKPGEVIENANFSLSYKKAVLGDFVWFDENENGKLDGEEKGLNGVEISLHDAISGEVYKTESNNYNGEPGYYSFEVVAGEYYLEFEPNDRSLKLFGQFSGNNDLKVSGEIDFNSINIFKLKHGEKNLDQDVGFVKKRGVIGGKIWLDKDVLGKLQKNESGIDGVTVYLYNDNGEQLKTVVSSFGTFGSGSYVFNNLLPGNYYVKFKIPEGYRETIVNPNYGIKLSSKISGKYGEGTTDLISLSSGVKKFYINAGLVLIPDNYIGDYVWLDKDEDGYQDKEERGVNNIEVQLFTKDSVMIDAIYTYYNNITGLSGFYTFNGINSGEYYLKFIIHPEYKYSYKVISVDGENDSDITSPFGTTDLFEVGENDKIDYIDAGLVPANCAIGDFVWEDMDGNGVQDDEEPGVDGIEISLYKLLENKQRSFIARDITENGGKFLFGQLSSGNYYYVLNLPDTLFITKPYQGDDGNIDSDINDNIVGEIGSNSSDTIHLEVNERKYSIDAGLIRPCSIEGYVWEDKNQNGLQDIGEAGVENVVINVYSSKNESRVGATQSNSEGKYRIDKIEPGNFYISLDRNIYSFTEKFKGNGLNDSDIDPITGKSSDFQILSGGLISNLDIGIVKNEGIKVEMYPNPANGVVNLSFNSSVEGDAEIIIADIENDRILLSFDLPLKIGTNYKDINIRSLNSGHYNVYLIINKKLVNRKIIIKTD